MTSAGIMIIGGMATALAGGAVYGWWIGTLGKKQGWSGKKIKGWAVFPPMMVGMIGLVASVISREGTRYSRTDPVWTKFPWVILVSAAFLSLLIAAKIARPGTPVADLDRDDLSIR